MSPEGAVSDKCPQVMSPESEDYKFENEKRGVELERSDLTRSLYFAFPLLLRLQASSHY